LTLTGVLVRLRAARPDTLKEGTTPFGLALALATEIRDEISAAMDDLERVVDIQRATAHWEEVRFHVSRSPQHRTACSERIEIRTGRPVSVAVVIVAAGRGRRLGSEIPKQYIPLGEKASLRRVCETFLTYRGIRWVLPVINAEDRTRYEDALSGLTDRRLLPSVEGGDTRARSVRNGLERLASHSPQKVLIHDAARPFLTHEVIDRVVTALDAEDGACAALPVVDALWTSENDRAQVQVPRDGLWRAQTPQGFAFHKILAAHRVHDGTGGDDVAVAREFGLQVRLVLGASRNYKITTAEDLQRALFDAEILDRGLEAVQKQDAVRR
jgi:2-C-methyl-D-erythritol 4-phosphate cytidylyltransferase